MKSTCTGCEKKRPEHNPVKAIARTVHTHHPLPGGQDASPALRIFRIPIGACLHTE